MLVHMTHPKVGELRVPERAVERYKANGWTVKSEEPPKIEQDEASDSEAFSFPEHKEES